MIRLYGYWRSTAAYRVRIALNLKNIEYETVAVNLIADGGEQRKEQYASLNPQRVVPTLMDGDAVIGQSMAILEYLEEKFPEPPILPADPARRALARQIGQIVACEVHPLNNLRVLQYLENELGIAEAAKNCWYQHWVAEGFRAIERLVATRRGEGPYCLGGSVTLADIYVVPQMYNAHRFKVPLESFPALRSIEKACLQLAPFLKAAPDNQPDAPK